MLKQERQLQEQAETNLDIPYFYTDEEKFYYYKTKQNQVEGPFQSAKIASCHWLLSTDIENTLLEFKQSPAAA